jgi:tRNA pseudouridine13 synthase
MKKTRKQLTLRFTDFLVNEVGLDGEVLRLKDVRRPVDPYDRPKDKSKGKQKEEEETKPVPATETPAEATTQAPTEEESNEDLPESLRFEPLPLWTTSTTRCLRPVFSDESIKSLHALFVEGKEPPIKVDSGWGTRKARVETAAGNEEAAMNVSEESAGNDAPAVAPVASRGGRGQGRDRGRGRGGRGGRGGGRGGESDQWVANKDDREVLSQVR